MATVSDSVNTPRSSTSINSPPVVGKTPPPPPPKWANVVRGDSESIPAAPSSPSSMTIAIPVMKDEILPDFDVKVSSTSASYPIDISVAEAAPPDIISDSGNNASSSSSAKSKKPAWTKPSNSGATPVEVSPLMGSVSWPALTDSAKASPKSSSDSLKALPDGSASLTQGVVAATSQPKSVHANANPNSNPTHQFPTKQKPFKRNQVTGGGSANGGTTQPPTLEVSNSSSPKTASGSSPRDAPYKSHNWEGGQRTGMVSQSNTGNDHQQQRNSYRRGGGSGGGHHRAGAGSDGFNNHTHGNRREQDRPNHDSNPPRGFNGRDGHMPQRVNQRNFARPMPPTTAPFISQPPVRPFANAMGFPDIPSPMYIVPTPPPESLRGVQFFPQVMFLPPVDPNLPTVVAKQIEYYFSADNLCKDIFLRKHMDLQGWVPLSLIADFNRVKLLTNNIQFILESVRNSTVVEVQGDKIRRRNDWMNWTLAPRQPASPSDTNHDVLANHIQSIGLEEGNTSSTSNVNGDAHLQPALIQSSSEVKVQY